MRRYLKRVVVIAVGGLLLHVSACQQRAQYLGEMTDVNLIDSVRIENNAGSYTLTTAELSKFRQSLGRMRYCGGDIKTGSIGFVLYRAGKPYGASGRTHSRSFMVTRKLFDPDAVPAETSPHASPDLLFDFTEPLNLDNYRRQH